MDRHDMSAGSCLCMVMREDIFLMPLKTGSAILA
jgi:hypothetical protein